MHTGSLRVIPTHYTPFIARHDERYDVAIACNWNALRSQLLLQWRKLNARDLDRAGPNRYRVAKLIEQKYGIASELVENYLRNFERTMPLTA